jgi:putative transposase
METVTQMAPVVGIAALCAALGLSRATFYRRRGPKPALKPRRPPRKLSSEERAKVLAVLHEERFVDQAPAEVYATLLDEEKYLCSERTMYRVLAENHEVRERRDQLVHAAHPVPRLEAAAPNQVWSWDITKLLGPAKWTYFYLYVVLDLFSRYVVGWMVADKESNELAKRLLAQTYERQNIAPGQLAVHADRGPSMTSKLVAHLFADLGVVPSHSRPRVSNDNPFSEAQFKTLKYRPEFPDCFGSQEDAQSFCRRFFDWYNTEHHHGGLGLLTPHDVHHGLAPERLARRAAVLVAAHRAHPERFVRGLPTPPALPSVVWINRPSDTVLDVARKVPLPGVLATRQETNAGSRVDDGGRDGGGRGVGEAEPLPLTPRAAPGTPEFSTESDRAAVVAVGEARQ